MLPLIRPFNQFLLFSVVPLLSFLGSGGNGVMGRHGRLVQWQVAQLKHQKLEFLMPWWDLQVGISVNQFLLIYASKNADFRLSFLISPSNFLCTASLLLYILHASVAYPQCLFQEEGLLIAVPER
jgi:hypothetical protein